MYDRYCIKCHMYTIIIISLPAQVLPLFPLVTGRLRARLCNFESHTSCSRRTPLIAFLLTLLLLLLSRFSRVRLCATPETAAHQAPPSLGFSRQEHWSGLPFPSPMHESEKWKFRLLVTPWTAAYQAPPSMGFSRQEYWSGVPLPSPIFKECE